ncbi:MAG: Na+/H+ antiporter subunit E [Alphaproteobacteria bacterium]
MIVKYNLTLGAVLFTLWILLSGHFSAQILLLGVASCCLVVWLSSRMRLGSQSGVKYPHIWRTLEYAGWLAREILISNINVARIILDPKLPIRPVLFFAPAGQETDLGRVIFANSITLTPGTISVEIAEQGGRILVHALHEELSWGTESCDMDARVCALGV